MKKRRTKAADLAAKPAAGGDSPAVSPAAATPAEVSDAAEGEAPAEVEASSGGAEANHADAAAADHPAPEEGATNEENGEEGDPESAAAEGSGNPKTRPDIAAMLAEAEERGYMRGRNERIEELMREPAPYCRQEIPVESSPRAAEQGSPRASAKTDGPMILNNPKVSIWDL